MRSTGVTLGEESYAESLNRSTVQQKFRGAYEARQQSSVCSPVDSTSSDAGASKSGSLEYGKPHTSSSKTVGLV